MNYSARHAVLFFITLGLAGAQIYSGDAQIYSGDLLADDIPIRVNLSESFIYYTAAQDTLFVNSNGLLSFGQPYTFPPTSLNSYPPGINEGVPIIAPFYADIDTTFQGRVSIMEMKDTQLVDTILSLINMSFEQTTEFSPSSIYNISWEGVVSEVDQLGTQKNTFHSILASDGQISYVLMMYTQISWTLTNSTLPAWVGFSAGDGTRYTSITDTFSVSIRNLSSASNINQDGVWIFRVDENTVLSGDVNECEINNGFCDDICVNTEGSFMCQCSGGRLLSADKQTCEDCIPGHIRIVDGASQLSGRVEICISGHPGFGTVCDDHWDVLDARVACRQWLGYDVEAIPVRNAYFGAGDSGLNILLNGVACSGNETSLESCQSISGRNSIINCSHSEDAGVHCNVSCIEGSVRLLVGEELDFYEGFSQYDNLDIYDKDGLRAGRVEVCLEGTFVAVCVEHWDNLDARVVCWQLGFSPYGAISVTGSYFGQSSSTSKLIGDVGCTGSEDNITSCTHNLLSSCPSHQVATIVCQSSTLPGDNCSDGDLRLADGRNDTTTGVMEGRVEICINNAWGGICIDHFGSPEAAIVCNSFNLSDREVVLASDQGFPGSAPIFLTSLGCSGSEASLLDCLGFYPTGIHNCDQSQSVWIRCIDTNECATDEDICPGVNSQCINTFGSYECQCLSGFAEINENCTDIDECEDGSNVCEGDCVNTEGSYDCFCPNGTVWSADNHSCQACTPGEVRLVNGTSDLSGRVEVCVSGNEGFGTVCDDQWDVLDALVVCRQLGFTDGAIPVSKAFFGMGRPDQAILIDDVSCTGGELSLHSCFSVLDIDCDHSEDAGVICSGICIHGTVRLLVGEGNDFYKPDFSQYDDLDLYDKDGLRAGRVEVCTGGRYGTVCDDDWDNKDASVVCRQLGFSSYGAVAWHRQRTFFSEGTLPALIGTVNCTGNESDILSCCHVDSPRCDRFSDAGVICQEPVVEPGNCSDGQVRLVDGSNLLGRLEVCVNNAWGTVCDIQFGLDEVRVACAQLGGTAVRAFTSRPGSGPIFLSNLACEGNENNLLECSSLPIGLHTCRHTQDVGIECKDIDECAMDNAPCEHTCNNTIGSFECMCQDGYTLDENEHNCTDVDECSDLQLNNCSYYANCTNTDGGFECSCISGFYGDGFTCNDIDECAISTVCGQTATCINTNGSFICECPPGFENSTCDDIDECAQGTHRCDINAECQNMDGSFNCSCKQGFVGNGFNCSCQNNEVFLFGGNSSQGQIGICNNNVYEFICDDFWDELDAQVVCRQLGLDINGYSIPTSGAYFGTGTEMEIIIALDNVKCSGNEISIRECLADSDVDCGQTETAGVICQYQDECLNGSVRLTLNEDYFNDNEAVLDLHGGEKYLGRIEVCLLGMYHTVCYESRQDVYASVICKQMGFSPYGALSVRSRFFSNLIPSQDHTLSLHCDDSANSLQMCTHELQEQCMQDEAGVVCQVHGTPMGNCSDGDVRLSDGENLLEGRVEICVNNAWGTVCGDTFSNKDAFVVCTSIGHPYNGTIVHTSDVFGEGVGPIFLSSLACDGSETSLLDCHAFAEIGIHKCSHSHDIGVTCVDYNECLVNNGNCSQICTNKVPGHVCSCRAGFLRVDDGANCIDFNECDSENVTCHENAECFNTEGSYKCICRPGFTGDGLINCTETCVNGSLRLASNGQKYSGSELYGRVEICIDGQFGTICDDSWSYTEASVVCSQLKFSPNGAIPLQRGLFGDPNLPTLLSGVSCNGTEAELLDCHSSGSPPSACGTFNDAAVVCQNFTVPGNCTTGDIRLVPRNHSCGNCDYVEGRVETCINNAWGSICQDSFLRPMDSGVLCSLLGGYFTETSEIIDGEPGSGPIFIERLECTPENTDILDCPSFSPLGLVNCDHSSDLSIRCQDINECPGECSQICNNTLGSYICSCESGYRLLEDSATCEDIDECTEDSKICPNNSVCNNINGSFACDCGTGFQFQNGMCDDINECLNMTETNCHFNATCENSFGSFMCTCDAGFTGSGSECYDINECSSNTLNECQINATCINTIGNYTCECMQGFEGDGWDCQDINECQERPDLVMCNQNANCTNTIGSYNCSCNPGYSGTGFNCTDVDECETDRHTCDLPQRAICNNTDGSFTCQCRPGYTGSGFQDDCTCSNGRIRLMNGTEFVDGQMEGRVEVCSGNTYFTVCSDFWDALEANVVCRYLGHNTSSNVPVRSAARVPEEVVVQLDNLACQGDEISLLECSTHGVNMHECNSSEVAGVMCGANCSEGTIRLVVGDSAYDFYQGDQMGNTDVNYIDDSLSQGRVEICIHGSYSTICANSGHGWTNEDAAVVCSELGFTKYGATAVGGGFFTAPALRAVVTNFGCTGTEDRLYHCPFEQISNTECIHDAAVICQDPNVVNPLASSCVNGDVRLVNKDDKVDQSEGRVEICVNNIWGSVCNRGFNTDEADVICRQLNGGFEGGNAIRHGAEVYGPGKGPVFVEFTGMECTGHESRVLDCGILPLGYLNPICSNHVTDAAVICVFNECAGESHPCGDHARCIDEVRNFTCVCENGYTGNPFDSCTDIDECSESSPPCHECINTHGSYNCSCNDGYRTVNNGTFIYCEDIDECTEWSNITCERNAHCNNSPGRYECICIEGYEMVNNICQDINECETGQHNCSPNAYCMNGDGNFTCECRVGYEGDGVNCTCPALMLRLMNGTVVSHREGRVEVCYNNTFSTICDDFWDDLDARVVCNQLGFTGNDHVALHGSVQTLGHSFGKGDGAILLDNVICNGSEMSIFSCHSDGLYQHNCAQDHSEDAAVICDVKCIEGSIRLLPTTTSKMFYMDPSKFPKSYFIKDELRVGRVEVCYGGMYRTLCDDHWDNQDASVVCHQLGFSRYGAISGSTQFNDEISNAHVFGLNCSGTENSVIECQNSTMEECGLLSDAYVICEDINITKANCSDGDVRLMRDNKATQFEGRVEVCINNAWGTVSSKNFDTLEVEVICHQKGFLRGVHSVRTDFSQGTGPIFLSGLNCIGSEKSLLECEIFGKPVEFLRLSHSNDVGVHCQAECPDFSEEDEFYGDYVWPGNTPAEGTVLQTCFFKCANITGVNASKTCLGSGEWRITDFTNCPTERTCQLVNLTESSITPATVREIESIVNQSGIEDQNSISLNIISQQFRRVVDLSLHLDQTTTTNLVLIVDGVQGWSQNVTGPQSQELIEGFEGIINYVVQQPSFTNVSINASGLAFTGERKSLGKLAQTGRRFSVSSNSEGVSGAVSEVNGAAEGRISINIPSGIFSDLKNSTGLSEVNLAFVAYQTSNLFPLAQSGTRHAKFQISSMVIGASIVGRNVTGTSQNVSISMAINPAHKFPKCVFWNTADGDWKDDGCSTNSSESNNSTVYCECNHLTNFAIIANTAPVQCDQNLKKPNADFTECIDRVPDVIVKLSVNVTNNAYQKNGTEYRVGYGQEFGLECKTSSFFRTEWLFESRDPVPVVPQDSSGVHDYFAVMDHQPGQLYALRTANNIVTLRTLESNVTPFGRANIGIQDIAKGAYLCVATNGMMGNSTKITIQPSEWTPVTKYLRFSDRSDEYLRVFGSRTFYPPFFSTAIIHILMKNSTLAVNCYNVERRPIDVERNSYRYECSITSTNQFAIPTDLMHIDHNAINSSSGFCDYEMMVNTTHGNYSWDETVAGTNASLPCFYGTEPAAGDNGMAKRRCDGPRTWLNYYGGECITVITFRFRQLANATITPANAVLVLTELSNIVSVANETVDQSPNNLGIISDILSSTSMLTMSGNLTADDTLVNGSTTVVDGITLWPTNVLRNMSSGIVQSFELLAENLVDMNENFTNTTLSGTNVFFQGARVETRALQVNGAVVDFVSVSTVAVASVSDPSENGINTTDGSGSGSGSGLGMEDVTSEPESDDFSDFLFYSNLSVIIPPDAFQEIEDQNETGIFFSFYLIPTLFPVSSNDLVVGSPVVAASIAGRQLGNLSTPVMITLQILREINASITLENTMCVSWNFSKGNWSEVGCYLMSIGDEIVCECDHLTNFAILVDIKSRTEGKPDDDFVLEVITYIGSILSICGLIITIVTLVGSKAIRARDITKFHIQLCVSLMAMLIVFLVGVERTEYEGACTFMSCVILYFALSSVFWMGAEAVFMYKQLVFVFGRLTFKFIFITSMFSWGLPMIFVIIALCTLATGDNFLVFKDDGKLMACFIGDIRVLLGTFIVPMAVTILFNAIAFIVGVRILIKSARQKVVKGISKKNARATVELVVGICVIMVLFGLGWIFGILTINEASKVFQYFFVIFNVFQGFYFFIFICLFGKDGRNFWLGLVKFRSFRKSLVKSTLSNEHKVNSLRSGSTTVSPKNTWLSSRGSDASLIFQHTHRVDFELIPGLKNDNSSAGEKENLTPPTDDTNEANKLSKIIEEDTSLNGTNMEITVVGNDNVSVTDDIELNAKDL